MSPQLKILVILVGISLVVWFVLFIYRGRLERQGDEVFRTTPERLNDQQAALLKRVDKMSAPVWIVGTVTVILILATIGLWVYQGLGIGG